MLEIDRLILRQWRGIDRELFVTMNADVEVMRYFPSTLHPEETDALIEKITAGFALNNWGLWAVTLKETGEFIGFVGLSEYPNNPAVPNSPFVEIVWRLAKSYWGKGYAFEGATACLDYAFATLGLDTVYAFTALKNKPSWRLMEKLGMHNMHQDFNHPKLEAGHSLERHCLYSISKTSWER